MKRALLILLASASTLMAGDPLPPKGGMTKESIVPPVGDPLWNWFAGGSVGYLLDNEIGLATAHFGIDLPWRINGFDTSIFAEIGWAQSDGTLRSGLNLINLPNRPANISSDLHIVPLTLNGKVERPLFGRVNLYAGGGAGVAFLDASLSNGATSISDDDVVFYAHAFAGLVANLSEHFEAFVGVRWIYLDEADFRMGGLSVDLDDLGFSNDDFVIEAGGRLNF